MQVAQRGSSGSFSSNTSRGFILDRWYGEGYPLNVTIQQSTINYDGLTYDSSSISSITGAYAYYQGIEDGYKITKGKTLTLSFVASGSGTIQTKTWIATVNEQTFGSSITLTSTPTKYTITHTISNSGTGDDLYIGLSGSGGSMNVSLVQLEVGDTATPFEHKNVGQEILACQRYFYKYPDSGDYSHPLDHSSGFRSQFVTFPVIMRANPTLSNVTGAGNYTPANPDSSGGMVHGAYFQWNSVSSSGFVRVESGFKADAEL